MTKVYPRGGTVLYGTITLPKNFSKTIKSKITQSQKSSLGADLNQYLSLLSAEKNAANYSAVKSSLTTLENASKKITKQLETIIASDLPEHKVIFESLNSAMELCLDRDQHLTDLELYLTHTREFAEAVSLTKKQYQGRFGNQKGGGFKSEQKSNLIIKLCKFYESIEGIKPTYNETSTDGQSKPRGPFVRFIQEINEILPGDSKINHATARIAVKSYLSR